MNKQSKSRAYYNEFDPFAANWLRELIKAGAIVPGDVDERSILDVEPSDLHGYTQCHFFAGIGGWSYALRLAGWPDDRPIWTGSPPCQPFSVAGKQSGKADERHLWPAFFNLIDQRRPATICGEQVASAIRHNWFDDLQADLEREGYASGMVVLPACSVGAPHKRDRLFYFAQAVGYAADEGLQGWSRVQERADQFTVRAANLAHGLADALPAGRAERGTKAGGGQAAGGGGPCGVADTDGGKSGKAGPVQPSGQHGQRQKDGGNVRGGPERARADTRSDLAGTGPTNGFWSLADWLLCRDGKWRAVESGTFPLADGVSNRVGRLRGYGNAIVPQVAAEVIRAFMGSVEELSHD